MKYQIRSLAYIFGALLIIGCTSAIDMSPVSGKVTFDDGQPLLSGEILFISEEAGCQATGKIVNGSYRLTTLQTDDGAVLGKHQVVFRPLLSESGTPLISIPERYGKAETSGKTATVNPGPNRINFTLTIEDDVTEVP